jgi:hypothetical protein
MIPRANRFCNGYKEYRLGNQVETRLEQSPAMVYRTFLIFRETLTRSEVFCVLIAFTGLAVLFDAKKKQGRKALLGA